MHAHTVVVNYEKPLRRVIRDGEVVASLKRLADARGRAMELAEKLKDATNAVTVAVYSKTGTVKRIRNFKAPHLAAIKNDARVRILQLQGLDRDEAWEEVTSAVDDYSRDIGTALGGSPFTEGDRHGCVGVPTPYPKSYEPLGMNAGAARRRIKFPARSRRHRRPVQDDGTVQIKAPGATHLH